MSLPCVSAKIRKIARSSVFDDGVDEDYDGSKDMQGEGHEAGQDGYDEGLYVGQNVHPAGYRAGQDGDEDETYVEPHMQGGDIEAGQDEAAYMQNHLPHADDDNTAPGIGGDIEAEDAHGPQPAHVPSVDDETLPLPQGFDEEM